MSKRCIASIMVLTSFAFLAGCAEQTPEQKQALVDKQSHFIGVVDGCRVWEVFNPTGTNPFLARCPEGAAQTTWKTGAKVKTTQFTIGDQ